MNKKHRIFTFLILAAATALELNPLKSLLNLSPEYITLNGAYPWAVLFICVVFLFAKRRDISISKTTLPFGAGGTAAFAMAFFLPAFAPEFEVFRLLLAWIGLAFVFFGEAAALPALLLCIYGFGIAFPRLVNAYAGQQYAQVTASMVYDISKDIIPVSLGSTAISMITLGGERFVVIINAACSGAASLSVFLSVFALMTLDVPLPRKNWVFMLFFGLIGTSVQNILRLELLLLAGYYYGSAAVVGGESIAGYIIFPLWYVFFALVYLRYAKKFQGLCGKCAHVL